MDEEILREKIHRHLEELLNKLDEEKHIWMKDAIGMVTSTKEDKILIKSGIITDIGDWEEVFTRQTIDETIREFQDKKNWPRWTTIAPALIADLERSEDIAKEVAKKHGVNLKMVVDRTRANFVAEIDGCDLEWDDLLRRTYKHLDAMYEAWGRFIAWLHSKERLKIVRKANLTSP